MAGTLPTAVFALIGGGGLHGHRHIGNREGKAVQAQPGTSGSSSRTVKMPTQISSTSPYRKTWARRQGGMCAGWYWLHFQMLPPTQDPHRHRSTSLPCCEIRMNIIERKNKKYRQWVAGKEVWLFLASFYPLRTKSFKSQAEKQKN